MALSKLREAGVGLRRHDDPFFIPGNKICQAYKREGVVDIDEEQLCHQVLKSFPCHAPNCKQEFTTIVEYELHYNNRHRFVCSQCKKSLPSPHLLDLHISETHDSFFSAQVERKQTDMFRCYVEECTVKSSDPSARRAHCIEVHNYPHDFRFDQSYKKPKKKPQNDKKKETKKTNKKEEKTEEAMATGDTSPVNKNKQIKKFTFGQNKPKTFCSETPWHTRGKQAEAATGDKKEDNLQMDDLMETLPN